jgi:asparagine synthase (glutamine-hydrolysing)
VSIENYLILDDYELYGRIMGGMELNRKVHYRKHWEIPDDYDDYRYFKKYLYDSNDYRRSLQYLDFKTYLQKLIELR